MNLYKIMLKHFSEQDSKKGILTYLIAKSDNEVYEWLKSEPSSKEWSSIHNSWDDSEKDSEVFDIYDSDLTCVGHENFRERILRLRGDMNDEDIELSDLYYGATLYGWELVSEDVELVLINTVRSLGINVEII